MLPVFQNKADIDAAQVEARWKKGNIARQNWRN